MRSERDKMLSGELYDATHPTNHELRRRQEYGKLVEVGLDVWVAGALLVASKPFPASAD